jgi:hypothetical protein
MKIYSLTECNPDDFSDIDGVAFFSSREKAEAAKEILIEDNPKLARYLGIEERELDPDIDRPSFFWMDTI